MKGLVKLALSLTLFFSLHCYSQNSNDIIIGVLSSETGSSSETGVSHNFWIEQGLSVAGNINNGAFKIRPVLIDTQSDDLRCYDKLTKLLKEHENVAMVIGPVRSGCAKNLITNEISIPIISSLASATTLTANNENPDSWFFRANISDKDRLEHFVRYIGGSREFRDNNQFLIYDDQSDYGRGLASDIRNIISFKEEFVSTIGEGLIDVSNIRKVIENELKAFNVYILGGAQSVVAMASALQNEMNSSDGIALNMFTVGNSPLYLDNSISGLITIGEVGFRQNTSVAFESEYQWISSQISNTGHKFYPTIYSTARFIVPKAIESALSKVGMDYQIDELREAIRNELKVHKQFNSLSPPDSLSFNNKGDLVGNFIFPILEIEPSFKKIETAVAEPAPWVEVISQNGSVSFLESPITISLIGHHTDKFPVKVSLTHTSSGKIYDKTIFNLGNNKQKTVSFHVIAPGDYLISSNRDIYPTSTPVKAELSMFYLVCVVFSMIGLLTKNKTSYKRKPLILGDWAQGIFVGLALAFLSTYIKYSIVPVVETDWNLLNGAMYGFIGGFFGPWLLSLMAKKVGATNN